MSVYNVHEPASDCDVIRDLIPDYAFGLTNADDTRLVEANLAYCLDAAEHLTDFRLIQAQMREDVPQMEPPAHLEERLMAAINAPAPVIQIRRRVIPYAWLAVAAAVVVLVLTNAYWLVRVDDLSRRQDTLAAQVQVQNDNAFVLTSTSSLRWVRLPPSETNGDASAFLMWNAESEIGLLYARGFPTLAAGNTYQLWLTRGDEKVSAGTFRVDENGAGALLFHSTKPIDQFTWARITAEPESGSDQPTGLPVVNGEL